MSTNDFSNSDTVVDDTSYASRPGQKDGPVPVVKDSAGTEDVNDGIDPDSDKALERDDKEAINTDNIIESRTRGATKQDGTYAEPGDDEGLPSEDGTSNIR